MAEIVMPRLSDTMEEGTDPALAQARRRARAPRRGAGRDRDRQGRDGLRVRPGGRLRDRRRRRATRSPSARRSRTSGRRRPARRRHRATVAPGAAPLQRAAAPHTLPYIQRERSPRPPADALSEALGAVKASPLARRIATSAGWTCATIAGSGPGGRIVKADVEAAGGGPSPAGRSRRGTPQRPRARRPSPAAAHRRRPSPPATLAERVATAKGETHRRGADPHPADDRAADGRVEGDDPRLRAAGGDRHGGVRGAALRAQAPLARGGAHIQRHGRQGVRAGAARAPPRQRQLPRRQTAAALARQRRRRRGGRPDDPMGGRWSCRRSSTPTSSRSGEIARETRALAERVRAGTITPPGAGRRHVHGLQPRDVRRAQLHRDRQPPAGRDPLRRLVASRAARPWCATARSSPATRWPSRSPATTASSTAPTPPASSRGSGSCWRSRRHWRCDGPLIGEAEPQINYSSASSKSSIVSAGNPPAGSGAHRRRTSVCSLMGLRSHTVSTMSWKKRLAPRSSAGWSMSVTRGGLSASSQSATSSIVASNARPGRRSRSRMSYRMA